MFCAASQREKDIADTLQFFKNLVYSLISGLIVLPVTCKADVAQG